MSALVPGVVSSSLLGPVLGCFVGAFWLFQRMSLELFGGLFEVWLDVLVLVEVARSVLSVVPCVDPVFGCGGLVDLCLP